MRIAILGLGQMGHAVSQRLLKTGYHLTVWNRTSGKASDLVAQGAHAASNIAEAVRGADVVLTLLTADPAVREVYLGPGGVISSARPETILIDMSTVSPSTSREVGSAAKPGQFLDAPILGGPEITAEGKARLLLGGSEQTVHKLDNVWKDLVAGTVYCGGNGTATTMKLLSNLILIGGTILLAEAVVTADRSGVGTEVVREVLGTSPAVASGVRVRLDDIMTGDHRGWWTIELAEKDTKLALLVACSAGLDLTLGTAAQHVLQRTDKAGHGQLDLGAVVEPLREE
ncbi:MAG: NAD(P)-dependent oxidoreductase [Chloroflexota bacterium]